MDTVMKRKDLTKIFLCLAMLLLAGHAVSGPIPDTGQTKCYDDSGEIPCPSPGQLFYGQDANYSMNPPSYTKLDHSGNALPDSAASWAMVKDNVTGLIWETKTDDGTIHDKDNTYTWYDNNPMSNGGNSGFPGNGTDTEDFINALNDANFGGYGDWRLPTVQELTYLVDNGVSQPGPTIDVNYFPHAISSFYWSSNTPVENIYRAWGVSFDYGFDDTKGKNVYGSVRAVRGVTDSVSEPYVDNGDGTVTDTSTGLTWQQDTLEEAFTWEQALAYCEGLSLGGHEDWRLPSINELRSLANYGRYNPSMDTTFFPNAVSLLYWSSTTYASNAANAWGIFFLTGGGYSANKGSLRLVRAVRGGMTAPPSPCLPDIKANGQDGPLTVSAGTAVIITVSLSPGDEDGKQADWWLIASAFGEFYSYPYTEWIPGVRPVMQSPLVTVSPVQIYSGLLQAGTYIFYFGVDTNPDDIVDEPLFYDWVEIRVIE